MIRLLTAAMTVVSFFALNAPALADDFKDPIKMTLHDWTGQLITTRLMGEALKNAGLNVEYVPADYLAQFAGLKTGDLDVAMEIWETTGREAMDEATGTGKVENLGETGMMAIEEWWYPDYMKEKCPGLPDWEALKKCAEQFSTAETAPKGRYLGGPATWGGFDEERVAALDLPFEVVHAGTDAALFAELESATQRKAPIIQWVYAPHWAPIKYKGEWVEFPQIRARLLQGSGVGHQQDGDARLRQAARTHLEGVLVWAKDKWPSAYEAIKKFNITNDEMGALITKVDIDGQKVEDVVAEWMKRQRSPLEGLDQPVIGEPLD